MEPLIRRLSHYTELSEADRARLGALRTQRQSAERGRDIIVAGQALTRALVVHKGWAVRYQMLDDGRRQILNILLPGDMFDMQVFVAAKADHSVMAVTDMELITVAPQDVVLNLFRGDENLSLAFWWAAVQEEAILRQQIVRNGRRTATERVAHFLMELHRRALIIDEAKQNGFHFPLTQTIIGDALGLSHIHVNRILGRLTAQGYIERDRNWIELADARGLAQICDFDPSYLNIGPFPRRMRLPSSVEPQF
ncbi:MAG TPA: Crp/Fnr family transcriptional regulator [Parvibaculum sp.]